MQLLNENTKFAHLGKPGTAFTKGFQRRLDMISGKVNLNGKTILDTGCGEGVWLSKFAQFTDIGNLTGTDIDPGSLEIAKQNLPEANLVETPAESLPFENGVFDIVFSNEVIEHVIDDYQVVSEMVRVTKPGGYIIIFTPNRGWPFEQHGMFWKDKYVWGNIPLLPWMPKFIYKRFAPHVRNYWRRDLTKLISPQPVSVFYWSRIFPGFDGLVRKFGRVGRAIRFVMHKLEGTPFRFFGISHFVILQKND